MDETITSNARTPSRGRSVGLVPFLFGVTGRDVLPGSVLRQLLGDVGLSPDAARAVLSRMRRHGQLASDRRGRGVEYRLIGEFARSFQRVRDQATGRPTEWHGHLHALLYQVPERHRSYRDTLRRSAVLCGYGILQPGVLIAPTDRSSRLAAVLSRQPEDAQVWLSTLGMTPDHAARAASIAWDLPELARRYHQHISRLAGRLAAPPSGLADCWTGGSAAPEAGIAMLRDYVDLLAPALIDTLRNPGLPAILLPADWPVPALQQTADEFTATFRPTIQSYLDFLLGG